MISLISERGVPESSRNFVNFGPHRMSTGELKTMYHANPTRILTHSHTQLLTHSHTHTLNTHTPKHFSRLRHWHTQVEGGRRRMSVREARTRLPSGFAMFRCGWLRRGGRHQLILLDDDDGVLIVLDDIDCFVNQVLPWDPILAGLWPKQLALVQEQTR